MPHNFPNCLSILPVPSPNQYYYLHIQKHDLSHKQPHKEQTIEIHTYLARESYSRNWKVTTVYKTNFDLSQPYITKQDKIKIHKILWGEF